MLMSDAEQMQVVKVWRKKYGYYILFSILFVVATNFGWRYFKQYQDARLEHISMIYMQTQDALNRQKSDEVKLFGEKLIKDYSKSVYANLAALILAKDAVYAGDLKSAEEKLQFVIKKSSSKELRELARIRAARVLIAMKKPQNAIDLLASTGDADHSVEVNEVLGDALLETGKAKEAEQAYRKAYAMDVGRKPRSPLLKMKMQQF